MYFPHLYWPKNVGVYFPHLCWPENVDTSAEVEQRERNSFPGFVLSLHLCKSPGLPPLVQLASDRISLASPSAADKGQQCLTCDSMNTIYASITNVMSKRDIEIAR